MEIGTHLSGAEHSQAILRHCLEQIPFGELILGARSDHDAAVPKPTV